MKGSSTFNTIKVFGGFVLIFYQKRGTGGAVPPTKQKIFLERIMEEWIDKEVNAVIETEFDEVTGEMHPVIAIGDRRFSWEEFGREVETFEGWRFDFKFSSLYMPPEVEGD